MNAPRLDQSMRRRLWLSVGVLALVLALSIAWAYGPLHEWLDVRRVVAALNQLGARFGPLVGVCGFALACVVGVPLVFLTMVSIVAYGPVVGSITALVGGGVGAAISYGLGHALGNQMMRNLAGPRLNDISMRLAKRGVIAAFFIRLVPVAPFALVNMIAGGSHMRFRDFLIGGTLGLVPGTLLEAFFIDSLITAVHTPGPRAVVMVAGSLLLIVVGGFAAKWWLGRPDA